MTKAKLILSGIALFAVIGGAFAFKAHKFGAFNRVYTSYTTETQNGDIVTRCGTINFASTLAAGPLSVVYTSTAATVPSGIICVTTALTTTRVVATVAGH